MAKGKKNKKGKKSKTKKKKALTAKKKSARKTSKKTSKKTARKSAKKAKKSARKSKAAPKKSAKKSAKKARPKSRLGRPPQEERCQGRAERGRRTARQPAAPKPAAPKPVSPKPAAAEAGAGPDSRRLRHRAGPVQAMHPQVRLHRAQHRVRRRHGGIPATMVRRLHRPPMAVTTTNKTAEPASAIALKAAASLRPFCWNGARSNRPTTD